jgi:hypothetical protein
MCYSSSMMNKRRQHSKNYWFILPVLGDSRWSVSSFYGLSRGPINHCEERGNSQSETQLRRE